MSSREGLTRPQFVLLAARRLTAAGMATFHLADLAVTCWQDCPALFSLPTTLASAPHVQVLSWTVQGKRGLVATGRLAKVGKETYALTSAGAALADAVAADRTRRPLPGAPKPRKSPLPARVERAVLAALDSPAMRKWEMGLAPDVTWAEAAGLWGDRGPAGLAADLARAHLAIDAAGPEVATAAGRVFGRDDLNRLGLAAARLAERFERQLARKPA